MRARVFIAAVLLALQLFIVLQGGGPAWLLWPGLLYLAATAAVLRWARPRSSDSVWSPRWALTLWMDLAMFALLQYFQQGNINYTPLFALPVLLAAILGPLLLALGSAAAATLLLLWDAWSISLYNPDLATTRFCKVRLPARGCSWWHGWPTNWRQDWHANRCRPSAARHWPALKPTLTR